MLVPELGRLCAVPHREPETAESMDLHEGNRLKSHGFWRSIREELGMKLLCGRPLLDPSLICRVVADQSRHTENLARWERI